MTFKLVFSIIAAFSLGVGTFFYLDSKDQSKNQNQEKIKENEVDITKDEMNTTPSKSENGQPQNPQSVIRNSKKNLRDDQKMAKKAVEESLQRPLKIMVGSLKKYSKGLKKVPLPQEDVEQYKSWGEEIYTYGDLAEYYLNFKNCLLNYSERKLFKNRKFMEDELIEALTLNDYKTVQRFAWCESYLGDCDPYFIRVLPHKLTEKIGEPLRFEYKNSQGFVMSRNLGTTLYHFQIEQFKGKWRWKNTQACEKDLIDKFPRFEKDL